MPFRAGAAGVIDAVRPSPRAQKRQASAEASLDRGLKRIVDRVAPRADGDQVAADLVSRFMVGYHTPEEK